MRSLDLIKQEKEKVAARMYAALEKNDGTEFQTAFAEWTSLIEEGVMAEAKGIVQSTDQNVLMGRGVRVLTSEENTYYQKLIDAMRSNNVKQTLTNMDVVLPKTVIDQVFEDLEKQHPLLNIIKFQNAGALVEWIISENEGLAVWGDLTAAIAGELSGKFSKLDLAQKKLTAFMVVSKGMLDMGPTWIDRYVRAILAEAIAFGLEKAIVDADGSNGPIGMTRALTGAVDGVYPRKTPVVIDSLDPVTFGKILGTLSKNPKDENESRNIDELIMIINPTDYYTKVFPATTVRASDGTFKSDVFPFPTTPIKSSAVPANHAIFGIPQKYFFALGTAGRGGRIELSDDVKFFEDQRVYLIRFYGNGRPMDEYAFVYVDISALKPAALEVKIVDNATTPPTVPEG